MKHLIIYHSEDNDGLMSMAIIYNHLLFQEKVSKDDIVLLGADYGLLTQMLQNGEFEKLLQEKCITDISITDVSFNESEKMLELYNRFGKHFTWIDHHKPIIDFSESCELKNAKGLRDIHHSALYNAWIYYFNGKTGIIDMPDVIKYLSAFDSFTYKENNLTFEEVRYCNEGANILYKRQPQQCISYIKYLLVESYLGEPEEFMKFFGEPQETLTKNFIPLTENLSYLIEYGKDKCSEEDSRFTKLIKEYGDYTWTVNGSTACALFIQEQTASYLFSSVKEICRHAIVFKHKPNATWLISLYNTNENDDFDCGKYCKEQFNGGGHHGAAGATISQDQFIEILKNKKI